MASINFSFLTTMLKTDIMKKVEINHLFTLLTFGIQFQSLFAFIFGLMMQRGWEEWDGLKLCYSVGNPLISTDHIDYLHMCLKWGTSPTMNRLMMIKMDILSVSTILESALTKILERENQKILARLMWQYLHTLKEAIWIFIKVKLCLWKVHC